MKKFTALILLLIVCVGFMLTGCSAELTMPDDHTNVVSNGGFVVGAGNYMYFANAYNSYTNLTTRSDNQGNVNQYSLNRQLLDRETHPNSEWFKLSDDEDAAVEIVANKIAAYEKSNMYVVNEYLYFTTPNVHKNNVNNYEFNLASLFRIKLDGSDLKELYISESSDSKFYLTGNDKQQLLIYDDNTLKYIDVYKNDTSVKKLLNENVSVDSVVFPKQDGKELAYLYFTTNRDESSSFSGNHLNKVSIETGEVTLINNFNSADETVTLFDYQNGRLFYSITGGNRIPAQNPCSRAG